MEQLLCVPSAEPPLGRNTDKVQQGDASQDPWTYSKSSDNYNKTKNDRCATLKLVEEKQMNKQHQLPGL